MTKIKLKYVNTFSLTICFVVLLALFTLAFTMPARMRAETCSEVRPRLSGAFSAGILL